MSHQAGYCPRCHSELTLKGIESYTRNTIWNCSNGACRMFELEIKADPSGFVIMPLNLRGNFIYARNGKREEK